MNRLVQTLRVMRVAVVQSDVEVAHQHQARRALDFPRQPVTQAVQPLHFVGKLIAVWRLTVHKIAIDQAQRAVRCLYGGGDHTRLFVGKTVYVFSDIVQRQAADDGHAVVGFLAEHRAMPVAGVVKGLQRKFFIWNFQLLQAQHFNRVGGQPVEHLRQPHGQRVDVPGGNFHDAVSPCLR